MRSLGFLGSFRNLVNLTVMRGETKCGLKKNGRSIKINRLVGLASPFVCYPHLQVPQLVWYF